MTKIVISRDGHFRFSEKGAKRYAELKGIPVYSEEHKTFRLDPKTGESFKVTHYYFKDSDGKPFDFDSIERDDPTLVKVIEEMGGDAQYVDGYMYLEDDRDVEVVEIPDDVDWALGIDDKYGNEYIAERHRVWRSPFRSEPPWEIWADGEEE